MGLFKKKRDIGLILCGGGALGAYEMGAWKAIRESGLEKRITGVSGTSIGACNTAIFLNGDLEKGMKIWEDVVQKDLTYPNGKAIQEKLKGKMDDVLLDAEGMAENLKGFSFDDFSFENVKEDIGKVRDFAVQRHKLLKEKKSIEKMLPKDKPSSFVDYLGRACLWFYNNLDTPVFSQEGIERIIDEKIPLDCKKISKMDVFSTVTVLGDKAEPLYVSWKDKTPEEIKNIILTSAAIPVAFNDREIDGKMCVDGGLVDNKPIKPLYDLGYRKFIVVNLDNIESSIFKKEMMDVMRNYSGCQFIHIIPKKEFDDSPKARFVVNKELTEARMKMGYSDAKEAIDQALGGNNDNRF